jgi:hypothetical protein
VSDVKNWWIVLYEGCREEDGDVILGEVQSDPPIGNQAFKIVRASDYDALKLRADALAEAVKFMCQRYEEAIPKLGSPLSQGMTTGVYAVLSKALRAHTREESGGGDV